MSRPRREHKVHQLVRVAEELVPPRRVLMACHYGPRYAGCAYTEVRERPPRPVAVLPKRPVKKGDR